MSINSHKIAKFYEECQQAAVIKRQTLSHLTEIVILPDSNKIQDTQRMCKCQSLKKFWKITHKMLAEFRSQIILYTRIAENADHLQTVEQIISKIKYLFPLIQDNSQIRTKEDALQEELGTLVNAAKQKLKDPLMYYDIKSREATKNNISQIIKAINQSRKASQEITQPLYAHKMERQTKNILLQISSNQCKFDQLVKIRIIDMHATMGKFLKTAMDTLRQFNILLRVNNTKNEFLNENCKFFNHRSKISAKDTAVYLKDLTATLRQILCWVLQTKETIDSIQYYFNFIIDNMSSKIKTFKPKEQQTYRKLRHFKPQISSVIQVKSLFFLIKVNYKYLSLNQILLKLKNALKQQSKSLQQIQDSIKEELKKVGSAPIAFTSSTQLFQHFKSYKVLIDRYQKRQREIYTELYHGFNYFIADFRQLFSYGIDQTYQVKKVQMNDINKIFNSHLFDASQPILQSTSRYSRDPLSSSRNSETDSAIKMVPQRNSLDSQITPKSQIQLAAELIDQLKIVDYSVEDNKNVTNYNCALGPKLLLQGRIYLHFQGIYFESIFNKKNLFFGRTKMFIPRKQIVGVNPQFALGFIPDIIQVQTSKGSLYFHTYGKRQTMMNALTQCYFPQSNQQDQERQHFQQQFYECSRESLPPLPINYDKIVHKYQEQLAKKKYQNVSLKKMFRRYLSDDKFEYQGKQYQNYKVYLHSQSESIDPKSSPLTPEIPLHFQYKAEVNKESQGKAHVQQSQRLVTYKKKIPKIPFLSNGGDGICQQKQTYHWISPQQLMIESVTNFMGFSLIQFMKVSHKSYYKQQGSDLLLQITMKVQFTQQKTTDSLVRGPTISGVKKMFEKSFQIQQKYEKLMSRRKAGKKKDLQGLNQVQQLRVQVQNLQDYLKSQKKKFWIMLSVFLLIYTITVGLFLLPEFEDQITKLDY